MKQYTYSDIAEECKRNGYKLERISTGHAIYSKKGVARHISIPVHGTHKKISPPMAARLMKQIEEDR